MAYVVTFTSGSLKGLRHVVGDGDTVSMGRSHSCGIRPKEVDVSGKHALFRENGGVLELEVLSSHKTSVNGRRLAQGESVRLAPGARLEFGGSLVCEVSPAGDGADAETLGGTDTLGMTATMGGTGTLGGVTQATVATRASMVTATLGGAGETSIVGGPATATLGAGGATQTVATRATSAAGETVGTVATVATTAAPVGVVRPRRAAPARPPRSASNADDGETQMVTGLVSSAAGDTGLATGEAVTGDSDAGETQMLATQAISQTELNVLRGAHVRKQKRKIGLRAVAFIVAFGAIFSLYAWLSRPTVKTYLSAPQMIWFNGIVKTESGKVAIRVPCWNDGKATIMTGAFARYDLRLGDNWEVPYTIMLTNYFDKASLREDCETSFARWRAENMVGLWRDQGELRIPQFLGGHGGIYPGVRCLVHKYTRVDEEGENLAGTVVFFRTGGVCHVLMRELPAAEESRGRYWLNNVGSTLFVQVRNAGGENLFSSRHWEGTPAEDDERDPAVVLEECRERLESGDVTAWNDVQRMLYVTLRALEGRDDQEARDIRSGALDALQNLRKAQTLEWKMCQRMAFKAANRSGGEGAAALVSAQEKARDMFDSPNDERHYISGLDGWWRVKPEGGQ